MSSAMMMSIVALALVISMTAVCLVVWLLPDEHADDHPALDGPLGDIVRDGEVKR